MICGKCKKCKLYNSNVCFGEERTCDMIEEQYFIDPAEFDQWPDEMIWRTDLKKKYEWEVNGYKKRDREPKTPKVKYGDTLFYFDRASRKLKYVIVNTVDQRRRKMVLLFPYTNKCAIVSFDKIGDTLFKTEAAAKKKAPGWYIKK